MDLSYESRWLNLRRQIEDDIAYLEMAAKTHGSDTIAAKADALIVVRERMDEVDRVGAHRA